MWRVLATPFRCLWQGDLGGWRFCLAIVFLILGALAHAEAASCPSCEQVSALRTALTVVNLPEKWLGDERLLNAAELFHPFDGAMEAPAFVSLLLYLKADPRDFTVQQAQFALDYIHSKAVELKRDPGPEAGTAALWQAIGINSAARGDDLVLLQQRFAEVGVPPELIPDDLFFTVADRSAAATASSSQTLLVLANGDVANEAPSDAAENAKNAAALAKSAKLLANQEAAARELSDLASLLQAAMPGKSKRPWDQLESNTKALMSGSTANLSLLTGVLALKGNKGIKGGVAGLLAQTADSLTIQQIGPDGKPVAVPALGSLSEVLKYIGDTQGKKADAKEEQSFQNLLTDFSGRQDQFSALAPQAIGLTVDTQMVSIDLAKLARQAGVVVPQADIPQANCSAPEFGPANLHRLNEYLLGKTGLPDWGFATATYFDTRTSVSEILCAFSDGSYLVDDGQLRVIPGSGALQIGAFDAAGPLTAYKDSAAVFDAAGLTPPANGSYSEMLAKEIGDALAGYRR